jgi:hypothetical protein
VPRSPNLLLPALFSLVAAGPLVVACGSSSSHPATPDTTPSASDTSSSAPPSSAGASAAPSAAPSASAAAYDDPNEKDPATLTPEFDAKHKPTFPKATVDEHECWQGLALSGNAQKDFDALIAKCGTPTGAVEYVKPWAGKLHHVHDKRDTFQVTIHGGLCYRFFGVSDGSIQDLDILIEKPGGALVGDDKTNGPVAIIESDKAWCFDADGDYQFGVKIDGTGEGHYVFGVWVHPKR